MPKKNKLERPENYPPYIPDDNEHKFIVRWYGLLTRAWVLRDQPYRELGNQTLTRFWNFSRDEYDIIAPKKAKSSWQRVTKWGITRDKANGFIAKLARQLISPQILAQNPQQQIDVKVSKIIGTLHDWWQRISGYFRVYVDAVHKTVIDGTVHISIQVINGEEFKEVIPNEEIFIPNFYQPDIQKQPWFFRVQTTTWEEAAMVYWDRPNWKYVRPGSIGSWTFKDDEFKKKYNRGILTEDEVQIIHVYRHQGYDEKNKPIAKKYNVLINGVLMNEIDNTLNYKHNLYNIAKTVFEKTSDSQFYWGNSLANKIRYDAAYGTAFRSIILNKALLNLGRPLFNKGGEHIDEDVIVPFKITNTNMEKGDIFAIEGLGDPINQGDINILDMVKTDIDEATTPPLSLGQETAGSRTLGEIQLKDARAAELMEIFGMMMSFLAEDIGEQSVSNIVQFMPRKNVDKVVEGGKILDRNTLDVPDVQLADGSIGTMALNFTPADQQPTSLELAQEARTAFRRDGVKREIFHIDPSYLDDLKFLIHVVGNPVTRPSEALERLTSIEKYQTVYFNNPNINQKEATRIVVQANKDDESKLLVDQPAPEAEALAAAGGGPRPLGNSAPTTRVATATRSALQPA